MVEKQFQRGSARRLVYDRNRQVLSAHTLPVCDPTPVDVGDLRIGKRCHRVLCMHDHADAVARNGKGFEIAFAVI